MPSDSVASFLDRAQANRLLQPDQVQQLALQPDVSRMSLLDLTSYLEQHRILTPYQARMVRSGRGEELHFAGYPIQDELGPCPGGMAYRVLHPSLRTPLTLRRLRADWFAPADNASAYILRARAASTITHPHLLPILDSGAFQDEVYIVLEATTDLANLETLVREIGPMPAALAVDYIRQANAALSLVHDRGGWHGEVIPRHLLVGPLMETSRTGRDGLPLRRPGPNSIVKLAELGLVPIRPKASFWQKDLETLAYLPPERLDAPAYGPRGDLYGLGATLFYLLTGRPPFPGVSADEVQLRIRTAEPPPLEALRPDLPPPLVALIKQLLAKDSNLRPSSAAELEAKLAPFGRPPAPAAGGPAPSAPPAAVVVPTAAPAAIPILGSAPPAAYPAAPPPDPSSSSYAGIAEWSAAASGSSTSFTLSHSGAFSMTQAASAPVRREITAADRARTRMWFLVGAVFQIAAILLWCYFLGCFDSSPESNPPSSNTPSDTSPESPKKEPPKKKKRPIDER